MRIGSPLVLSAAYSCLSLTVLCSVTMIVHKHRRVPDLQHCFKHVPLDCAQANRRWGGPPCRPGTSDRTQELCRAIPRFRLFWGPADGQQSRLDSAPPGVLHSASTAVKPQGAVVQSLFAHFAALHVVSPMLGLVHLNVATCKATLHHRDDVQLLLVIRWDQTASSSCLRQPCSNRE